MSGALAALRPTVGDHVAASLADDALHLILMPTEACNFRCVYCYESFAHGRMARPVVDGIKRLLARRVSSLSSLTLSWFGGEPLLAREIMEEILEEAGALARAHPAMRLVSDVTTNAFHLTPEVFSRLVRLGVWRYQITLDGTREKHDRKRRRADGVGTFDRIWSHLLAMRDEPKDFSVLVRVHACPDNEEDLAALLGDFQRAFGDDRRFEVFLRTLERLGGPSDDKLVTFAPPQGREAISRLRGLALARGIRHRTPADAGGVCYAAKGNSFVIRADGRINKCTVALETRENQVGRLREDGRMELSAPMVGRWMRGLPSGDPRALQCPLEEIAS